MLTTGTHFREASEALAHCYADLLEGRRLISEEHSAAMRVLRMATAIIGTADPNASFDWERLREYLCRHAEYASKDEGSNPTVFPNPVPEIDDGSVTLTVLRNGQLSTICFRELTKGDITCSPKVPRIVVGENAHKSEDSDYVGWLVYDENGCSYFPEDFSPKLN